MFQDWFREALVQRLWILLEVVCHQKKRKSTVHTGGGLQFLSPELIPMPRKNAHTLLDILQARDDVNIEALEQACCLDLREYIDIGEYVIMLHIRHGIHSMVHRRQEGADEATVYIDEVFGL